MSARACQRACAPSLKLKAERGFDESSELFPFLPVIWCRTNRRWPRADQRHFRTSVSASTLCRASGRKIKVVTVCARGVPRHAQRFIWNKTKIPKGLKTFLQRCRFELYMLCTLSALARSRSRIRERRPTGDASAHAASCAANFPAFSRCADTTRLQFFFFFSRLPRLPHGKS